MKETKIFISVVMVMYNAEKYIYESVMSVLGQSFKKFELIIIDDGSTDNSIKMLEDINDERMKILHNNHDYIGSLNIGLIKAQGKYIARMDADDIMHPDRLFVQFNIMELNEKINFCSSWCTIFQEETGRTLLYKTQSGIIEAPLVSLLEKNIFTHPCMMFRKDFVMNNNIRYQKYPYAEDYKMWVEAAKSGAIFYIEPQALLIYRCHPNQVSSMHQKEQKRTSFIIKEDILKYLVKIKK